MSKRYPSIFVYEGDGFREGLNPSNELKQSIVPHIGSMDRFAEPVIGRAFARPVGSQ